MDSNPNQKTIIQNLGDSVKQTSAKSAWKWAVALVEGSGPDFTKEVNQVLGQRLKMASIILFVAYLAFYIKSLIFVSTQLGDVAAFAQWAHLLALTTSGIVAWRLCAK